MIANQSSKCYRETVDCACASGRGLGLLRRVQPNLDRGEKRVRPRGSAGVGGGEAGWSPRDSWDLLGCIEIYPLQEGCCCESVWESDVIVQLFCYYLVLTLTCLSFYCAYGKTPSGQAGNNYRPSETSLPVLVLHIRARTGSLRGCEPGEVYPGCRGTVLQPRPKGAAVPAPAGGHPECEGDTEKHIVSLGKGRVWRRLWR